MALSEDRSSHGSGMGSPVPPPPDHAARSLGRRSGTASTASACVCVAALPAGASQGAGPEIDADCKLAAVVASPRAPRGALAGHRVVCACGGSEPWARDGGA